jgi:hypothetical protein
MNFGVATVTTTEDAASPKTGFAHSIANVVVSVSGAEVCDPDVGRVPDKPATPRHVAASVAVQVSTTGVDGSTDVKSTATDTVGGDQTLTLTLVVATPPRPEHESVNVEVC